jgi:hypothetical protein
MNSPMPESPTPGSPNFEEADAPSSLSEEPFQPEVPAEARVQVTSVPAPPATETEAMSQSDLGHAGDGQPPPAADGRPSDQDEQPPPSLVQAQEHAPAGTRIDIRVGRGDGLIVGQWFEAVERHSGADLTPWVVPELKDYVPIGNETELCALLRDNHVLVLHADQPGSGRWTAALRLLSTFPERELTIRRIRRESGDGFTMTGLRGQRSTGWILDLRDPDESMPAKADFGHELLQASDLRADGSYLVVLASTELWRRIGYGATALARKPEPPDSVNLLMALLKSSGVVRHEAWTDSFGQEIKPLRPAQIREWSQVLAASLYEFEVKKGRPADPDVDDDRKEIEKTVRSAVSGWMEVLADWHKAPERTSYERNYLLLAAVYDGAPIDAVHRQVASLAKALGEKGQQAEPLAGQQGPGLVQLAQQTKAELLPNGRLRFPGPGFAEAVVRYFWTDRPHLANDFMGWTVQLSLELKHPQGSQLAERMAPWVLHHAQATSSTRLLRLVADEWSEDSNLAVHAHEFLVMASLDPQIGSRARKALSSWANQDGASPALLKTLARVFATLTPAHEQMLGRLGDLARSVKVGVPDAVGEAITALWDNREFRPRLSSILISWLDAEQEPLRQAAASAFLHLALQRDSAGHPILVRELQPSVPDWAIRGWRAALEARGPSPTAYQAFMAWLDTAATQDTSMEPVFATLVSAVHDTPTDDLRGQRFLNLGRLGERWVLQSDVLNEQERNTIRHELENRTQLADPHRALMREENGPSGA